MNLETLNKAAKIAVEKNNLELLQLICTQGMPTNLGECMVCATEKGYTDIMLFLMKKNPVSPSVPVERPLVLHNVKLTMSSLSTCVNSHSTLLMTLVTNPEQALKDLESGTVSVKEINHPNDVGWTPLSYVARNAKKIPKFGEIMQKLLDLGADVNENTSPPALPYALRNSAGDSTEEAVAILLKHPKININFVYSGETALTDTLSYFPNTNASLKSIEMVLKDPRLDINHKNPSGMTILQRMFAYKLYQEPRFVHLMDLVISHKNLSGQLSFGIANIQKFLTAEQRMNILQQHGQYMIYSQV